VLATATILYAVTPCAECSSTIGGQIPCVGVDAAGDALLDAAAEKDEIDTWETELDEAIDDPDNGIKDNEQQDAHDAYEEWIESEPDQEDIDIVDALLLAGDNKVIAAEAQAAMFDGSTGYVAKSVEYYGYSSDNYLYDRWCACVHWADVLHSTRTNAWSTKNTGNGYLQEAEAKFFAAELAMN
jgi:hypothetical protein